MELHVPAITILFPFFWLFFSFSLSSSPPCFPFPFLLLLLLLFLCCNHCHPTKKIPRRSCRSKKCHSTPTTPKLCVHSNDDDQDGKDERTRTTKMMTREGINKTPPLVNGCRQPSNLELRVFGNGASGGSSCHDC